MDQDTKVILEELEKMQGDTKIILSKVSGLQEEMAEVRTEVAGLKEEMAEVRTEIVELKVRVTGLESEVARLDDKIDMVQNDVTGVKLRIENELCVNIKRIAEGHLDLSRNLHEATKHDGEIEMLSIRVKVLEGEVKELKKKTS